MVAWLGALVAGCATSYGPALSNSGATPVRDLYLYGPHLGAERTAAVTTDDEFAASDASSPPVPTSEKREKPAKLREEVASRAAAERESGGETSAAAIVAGTYRGTDWVTIDLPGFPGSEQVDDQARVVLKELGDGEYAFTVLDTNSGNELCSVQGAVGDGLIGFEPGQACFSGILGIPMETSLYEGEGRLAGEKLEVTLGIELTLTSAEGDELTGDLSYRFEGKLSEAAPAKP